MSFDGVDTSSLTTVAAELKIKTVHATVEPNSCGLFSFKETVGKIDPSSPRLENDPNNTALILRTSGTSSESKVCALKMSSIVSNSRIIAKSLGLESYDVALNAMPLFHIGGLSSNLLSSLAAGGSVILMPNFDVEDFFHVLVTTSERQKLSTCLNENGCAILSSLAPTWFSAVPTMHAGKRNRFLCFQNKITLLLIKYLFSLPFYP